MKKRGRVRASRKKTAKNGKNAKHPVLKKRLTLGQRAADKLTVFAGSWTFIIIILVFMGIWMAMNLLVIFRQWDPYPFILLNFVLSCLAALQAPVILMSQNREAERDRINFKYDYQVNRKAEREIQQIIRKLEKLDKKISRKR